MTPPLDPAAWLLVGGLALASLFDVATGRIPSELTAGLLLLGGISFIGATVDPPLLAAIALLVAFSYGWYRAGAMGGADVELVCALCLLLPRAPVTVPLSGLAVISPFPFPLASVLLALILAQAVSIPLFLATAWARRRPLSREGMSASLGILAGVALFLALNPAPEHMLVPALLAAAAAALGFLRVRRVDVRVPFAPFLLVAVVASLMLGDPFGLLLSAAQQP